MKIFLTGASGLVGRNILEHPQMKHHEVLAPRRADLDLLNGPQVFDYIQSHRPDLVIHCAGRVGGIQANIENPVAFMVENLDISRNVILGAQKAGVKKFLNFGTSCMYPREAHNPLKEESILTGELEPTNEAYAVAKIAAQRLCAYIRKENPQMNYKTILPCNLYGRHDHFDPKTSHLIPAVILKIHQAKVEGQSEVEIWGDGQARREFLFCGDLAECVMKAIDPAHEGLEKMPEVMNVGLGRDYTVNEYYAAAARVIGYAGKFKHDLSKPVGMKQKLVSIERMTQWGWKSHTSLEEGLAQTYEFFKSTLKNQG